MLNLMTVKPLGNGRFQINGEDVYAPSLKVAEERFVEKHPEYNNDFMVLRKDNNKKVMQNHLTAKLANKARVPSLPKNNSYRQAMHD